MTYDEIVQEVIDFRFREGLRSNVKRWVNHREAMLWTAAEWPFRHAPLTQLSINLGDATPQLASDYDRPDLIFDDQGQELLWLTANDFDRNFRYGFIQGDTGRPAVYKWADRVLTLAPTPDTYYSYTHSYMRKLCHFNAGGDIVVGPMSSGTDYPMYDSQWHYILVLGALATGLKVENDPTYPGIEDEFNVMLQSMREAYLPSIVAGANLQYGRDELT